MELELAKSLVLVFLEQQRNENVYFMLSVADRRPCVYLPRKKRFQPCTPYTDCNR